MRRTFAVLALLATSWPQIVALECALASPGPSSDAPSEHAHAHGEHAGMAHGLPTGPASADEAPLPDAGRDCAQVMACGLLMIRAQAERTAKVKAVAPEPRPIPEIDAPIAADLVADPPPPRRNA